MFGNYLLDDLPVGLKCTEIAPQWVSVKGSQNGSPLSPPRVQLPCSNLVKLISLTGPEILGPSGFFYSFFHSHPEAMPISK